jgi:hypothetical protein
VKTYSRFQVSELRDAMELALMERDAKPCVAGERGVGTAFFEMGSTREFAVDDGLANRAPVVLQHLLSGAKLAGGGRGGGISIYGR